jgi:hypothetical protein
MKVVAKLLALAFLIAGAIPAILLQAIPALPEVTTEALDIEVEPLPLRASCPGALVEVGGEQGTDLGEISRVGVPKVSVHGAEFDPDSGFANFEVEGFPQSTELLSANQAQSVDRPRMRGLGAVNCPQPASFGYFVAGSSGPGNESVLIVSNPNQVEVLVEIGIYLSSEVATERVSLAAGEQKVIPLIALSGAEPAYAVSYSTSGLAISAFMQHRSVTGLTATGVALIAPQLASETGVIPGIEVLNEGFEPLELRVFNPGIEQAEVIVQIGDSVAFEMLRVLVPAGSLVTETVELAEGLHQVSFQSETAVALSVKNTVLEPTLDFSWFNPAASFNEPLRLIVPAGGVLYLANPGLSEINAVVQSESGQAVAVPARDQVGIPVSSGNYLITATAEFSANLVIRNDSGYANITPSTMKNLGQSLTVSIR